MASKKLTTPEEVLLEKYSGNIDEIMSVLTEIQKKKNTPKSRRKYGESVVVTHSLSKLYKVGREKVNALSEVSINIKQGEYVAITGASGSGKSTLLQLIGALDKPSEGTIEVASQDISKLSDRALSKFRNRTIGFVFQFFYLQPFLNLKTNLEVPGMFARTKRRERQKSAEALAESVSLSDRLTHLPNELSGGQMQRAAIARALMNKPNIILADEPTGNLDRKNAFAIMELFDTVRDTFNTTVIVVTHDAELASRADREIKMQDGRVVS
jgi:ABC-type lipoprotein export system ATPase subunit